MTRLFGTNGIRGIVGPEMNADLALKVGRAIGTSFGGGTVVLGRDTRLSGPMLARAAASGLMSAGCDVIDLGVVPTPCEQYFLAKSGHLKGGVVVAPGNGAGCVVTPYLLRSLGCRVISLNGQPDGAFPGRMPEPIPDHLGDLMRVVSEVHADLGIAHDGDADRAIFVDDKGSFVYGDKSLALLAKAAIQGRGGTVVTPVSTSGPVERRDAVLSSLVELTKGRKVDTTDGVKIVEPDGAVLVRPSGTEPIFRVYAEGRTPERAEALAREGADLIEKALGRR